MSATIPQILKYINDNIIMEDNQNIGMPIRAKKRRLDHLSWEEKLQRKKLKNRVAAQTSRDRKKAKVEQMETALQQLYEQNEKLSDRCDHLRDMNAKLTAENTMLRNNIINITTDATTTTTTTIAATATATATIPEGSGGYCRSCGEVAQQNQQSMTDVESDVQDGSTVSPNLLPQGLHALLTLTTLLLAAVSPQLAVVTAAVRTKSSAAVLLLWTILLAFPRCPISSRSSTRPPATRCSRSRSSRISSTIWRRLPHPHSIRKQNSSKWWGRHQNSWNPMAIALAA